MMEKINLRKALAGKLGKKARLIPGFLIRGLEKFLCVDRMNYVIEHMSHLPPRDFIGGALDYIGVRYRVFGAENVRGMERVVLAANHPLGGLDGLVLAHALIPLVGSTRLVVNDLLMHISPLQPLFLPINKHGMQTADYARGIHDFFTSNESLIVFPAGLCSRLIDGQVQDLEWKRNFLQKAVEYDRTIVPIYVSGLNSTFFYRLARFRAKLRVKFNIEMLWLPREMFRQKGAVIDIHIGQPIPIEMAQKPIAELVTEVRRQVYAMAPQRP